MTTVETIPPASPVHCESCHWHGRAIELVGEVRCCPACGDPWGVTAGEAPEVWPARPERRRETTPAPLGWRDRLAMLVEIARAWWVA